MDQKLKLYFYIDKAHYPYHLKNVSITESGVIEQCAPSTWLSWTFLTYVHLKKVYDCELVDSMPSSGIIFFFRGSVELTSKPNEKQFWICMVADASVHPYAHLNIFQNPTQSEKTIITSAFVRHWPQLNIIKSNRSLTSLENLYYFGNEVNLCPELKSEDWLMFLQTNKLNFVVPNVARWHDYNNVDAVIAIRSFIDSDTFDTKPASKMINSWIANTIFISTGESAYIHEGKEKYSFVNVNSYDDLKNRILKLKSNLDEIEKYKRKGFQLQKHYTVDRYLNDWCTIVESISKKNISTTKVAHYFFLTRRYLLYKLLAQFKKIKKRA